jgi:hypothetical protein
MEKPLSKDVVDLLTRMSTNERPQQCECGALMEHRLCAFFFAGKNWDVPLAFCPKCNPVSQGPPHHA